jgi:hydroxyacylglutathione hydrolase
VDPGNPALRARAEAVEALRAAGRPTLPVRLGDERAANPFLRVDDAAVAARVRAHAGLTADADRVAVFAALRAWKDGFTA